MEKNIAPVRAMPRAIGDQATSERQSTNFRSSDSDACAGEVDGSTSVR